jgi:hypothetical protein
MATFQLLVFVSFLIGATSLQDGASRVKGVLSRASPLARSLAGPFLDWHGNTLNEDPLAQVQHFLDFQDEAHRSAGEELSLIEISAESKATASVSKVHAFCEICILIMQMKERGQPHLCAGLNPDYFISCVENLESLLRADKAVTYWLRSGCLHLDREGPEIVKPCPAHAICAWVPNLFADVGIVTPRNELSPMCPRDFKYLPRIPRKPTAASGGS